MESHSIYAVGVALQDKESNLSKLQADETSAKLLDIVMIACFELPPAAAPVLQSPVKNAVHLYSSLESSNTGYCRAMRFV